MVSRQEKALKRSMEHPSTPNTPMADLTLFLKMSRIFHWVAKSSFIQSLLFSIAECLRFFGEAGRRVSAGAGASSFLQDRKLTRADTAADTAMAP